jgi:hypothetical protein
MSRVPAGGTETRVASGPGYDQQLQGDIGQRELLRLAQEARLLPIRPDPDRAGWDFCVQEEEAESNAPLDLRPAARRWMVQVKTVGRLESVVPISLTNWQRMAKEAVPWFVLVVEVIALQPKRAFLVHVGEFWIRKVLERLTKMAGANEERLNTRKMALRWRSEDELSPSTGPAFAAALRKDAGADPAAYAAQKNHFVENVGYDGPRYRGTLKLPSEGFEQLAELAVGLRENLPVAEATVDRVRFGIPLRELEASAAVLSLQSPPVTGRARVTNVRKPVGTRCTLEFDIVKATKVFPSIPQEHDRAVLRHPIVQIHVRASNTTVDLHYKLPETEGEVALAEIGPASEFIATIAEAPDDVPFEFQHEGGSVSTFALRDTAKKAGELARAAVPIANAWAVARRLGLEHVRVLPWELAAQHERLLLARIALDSRTGGGVRLGDPDCNALADGVSSVIGYNAVLIGDRACVMGMSCSGIARLELGEKGPRLALDNGTFRAHAVRVLGRAEFEAKRDEVQQALEEATFAELSDVGTANIFVPRRSPSGDTSIAERLKLTLDE